MKALQIDGQASASRLMQDVAQRVARLKAIGVQPCLAVVLVGDDAASDIYVRTKAKRAEEAGIRSLSYRMPAITSQAELLETVRQLNCDPLVHGILVQMPLPSHIDSFEVIEAILPAKDVDGFHSQNVGALAQGRPGLVPCTPAGCMQLLRETVGDLTGKHAVMIGRSNIVGKPLALMLLQADCTVTVIHSRSRDSAAIARMADIVIAAAGRQGLVNAQWVKPGAVVVDVGIHRVAVDGKVKLVGDVDFADVATVASAITPVPGGVGPMTIAYLLANTVTAAAMQSPKQ